ncbi:MAG: glycosyltransferase family 2 protein [Coriobacteriales bacterium]|jgi:GT2 family glycosyltransferase|nr:glycosyltransferase family 2 protein [Coriobacteriales bacterium]
MPQRASASIVTFNNALQIPGLLESMRRFTDFDERELFVIDNASDDAISELLKTRFSQVRLLQNERNLGFGTAHNKALPFLDSRYHVLINPDILFVEDALSPLLAFLDEHPEVAMATCRILNPDGSEQKLPKLQPRLKYLLARRFERRFGWARRLCRAYVRADEDFDAPTEIETCTGSFSVIRTEVFRRIGGFDERFFLYFEDNDLSRRAREYGSLIFYPQVSVIHQYQRLAMSNNRAFLQQIRSMVRYFNKYGWR